MLVYLTVFNDFFFKLEQLVSLKYAKNLKSPIVVFFENKNGISKPFFTAGC